MLGMAGSAAQVHRGGGKVDSGGGAVSAAAGCGCDGAGGCAVVLPLLAPQTPAPCRCVQLLVMLTSPSRLKLTVRELQANTASCCAHSHLPDPWFGLDVMRQEGAFPISA